MLQKENWNTNSLSELIHLGNHCAKDVNFIFIVFPLLQFELFVLKFNVSVNKPCNK